MDDLRAGRGLMDLDNPQFGAFCLALPFALLALLALVIAWA